MEVLRARSAGFCFGVKRAIDLAEETAAEGAASTYGPLIHNRQVVERLAQQGVEVVTNLDTATGTIIVRSHGIPPEDYTKIEELDLKLVDATCPFVQKAQRLAAELAAKGRIVIVVGDRDHPEVQGIIGWTGNKGIVVANAEEAEGMKLLGSAAVLAQTTQPEHNFRAVVEVLNSKNLDLLVYNTICSATGERQEAAKELAVQVEAMVVVGGRESANTKKLAKICSGAGTPTYQVEKAEELELSWFTGVKRAGLTAGASTPDWIIEEVYTKMTEMNLPSTPEESDFEFEDMANWEKSLQDIRKGRVANGTVVRITPDEVFVDIGSKSEGIVAINELAIKTPAHPSEVVQVGDQIRVLVLRTANEDGYAVLSRRRAEQAGSLDGIEEAFKSGSEMTATVIEVVKGGLLVDIGMRGFVPASQIQRGFIEDLNQFLGATLRLRIIDFDPQKNKVVLSQKVIFEEEAKVASTAIWERIAVGDIVDGVVRRITDFGAFVDLGGVDGLLHISDLTYARIKHASEVVKEGDEIRVMVLNLDQEKKRISLGMKQLTPSPWDHAVEEFAVGALVNGTVVRIAPFGAFVNLAEGIDGLIHISQLSDRRVLKAEEIVKIGQEVMVKIVEIKPAEKRISLSLKDAQAEVANQEATEELMKQQPELGATIGDAVGSID